MRQAGRYLPEYRQTRALAGSFLDLCFNSKLASEVTLQPIRRFNFDAAIIFSDILLISHALGQKLEFQEGEGPRLDPLSPASVKRLSFSGLGSRLSPVYEAIRLTVDELKGEIPLIGFCGAPWTVASYMIEGGTSADQKAAKMLAYGDPAAFSSLLDILVEASSTHLIAQIDAGAQILQIFDSWAGNLADDDFEIFVAEPTARIVERVKAAHPKIPIIGFPRGSSAHYKSYVQTTKIDALGCDTGTPLVLMAEMQQSLPVQGNLDPVLLLAGGDAMERRIAAILNALASRPFIFNLGHGVLPETPIENVTQLVRIVRNRIPL